MKREMARQNKVFSYMDEILDKYDNSDSKSSVVSIHFYFVPILKFSWRVDLS